MAVHHHATLHIVLATAYLNSPGFPGIKRALTLHMRNSCQFFRFNQATLTYTANPSYLQAERDVHLSLFLLLCVYSRLLLSHLSIQQLALPSFLLYADVMVSCGCTNTIPSVHVCSMLLLCANEFIWLYWVSMFFRCKVRPTCGIFTQAEQTQDCQQSH